MEEIQKISLEKMTHRTKWTILLITFGVMSFFWLFLGVTYGLSPLSFGIWKWIALVSGCMAIIISVHEALHGLLFWVFGGKVKFGAKLKTSVGPIFWATSDKLFSKRQYRIISLAPQILTLTCVLIIFFAELPTVYEIGLWIIAVGNLCGGGFDIYISCILDKFPAGALFQDKQDGVQVYVK